MMIAATCLDGNDGERSSEWVHDIATIGYAHNLPPEFDELIEQRYPGYRPTFSKTVGKYYFANVCPHCDSLFGEHYLYEAFLFADDLVESAKITWERLPFEGEYEIDADPSWGIAEAVFECGTEA